MNKEKAEHKEKNEPVTPESVEVYPSKCETTGTHTAEGYVGDAEALRPNCNPQNKLPDDAIPNITPDEVKKKSAK
ncbi:MAG TPA: hypothetical protein PKJ88_06530 [Flexilinea sp.]|nr:hypothetical protein [Flexilinea sp.]